MNISATLNGESVTIVQVIANGSDIYISYIDSNGDLRITKTTFSLGVESVVIATNASI